MSTYTTINMVLASCAMLVGAGAVAFGETGIGIYCTLTAIFASVAHME